MPGASKHDAKEKAGEKRKGGSASPVGLNGRAAARLSDRRASRFRGKSGDEAPAAGHKTPDMEAPRADQSSKEELLG